MRLNLLSVMALGLAVTGASCFAAGNASNDAPDLDIGTLVSEGNGIATQQKATDDALKQLSDDDKKLHSDKSELSTKMADYDKSAADFMSRCNHPFVQGQERELAACKDENDQNLQVFKQLSATQKEIPKPPRRSRPADGGGTLPHPSRLRPAGPLCSTPAVAEWRRHRFQPGL